MADKDKQSERGPFLSAALLCEMVLVEQNGVKSAIRIVDRVTRTSVGPNPPPEMEPFDYHLKLLIKFKSGWARGVHKVKVQPAKPSGELMPELVRSVLFEGEEDRGVDIIIDSIFKLDETGIYWVYIYLNDIRVTQIPLRVIYIPQIRQMPPRGSNRSQE
jgi:hypothetical protein